MKELFNVITQKPHDHLFQKSGQRWTRSFETNNDANREKWRLSGAVQPKTIPLS